MEPIIYPVEHRFQIGDSVIDKTAKAAGLPDVHGTVEVVDGSHLKVRYESGNIRWKMHVNLVPRESSE